MSGDSIRVGRRSIEVTNPQKLMFPDSGISKRALIDYYLAVSDAMLPLVKGRLITMERFPDGIEAGRFFQKSISDYFPDWIDRETVPKKGGTVTHVVINEKATLAYLGNQAAITLHMSLSRQGSLDAPDQMIFDLDPSVDDFGTVRKIALRFRELLDEIGLFSVVKTTGSRGLHVTVPLDESAQYRDVHSFAHDVARMMATDDPDTLTIEGRKEKRGDRIYLDWMRNSPAATAVVPYGIRALPGAPVAMPISWSDVEDRRLKPDRYRMKDAMRAVEQGDDPWKGWRRRARSLKGPRRNLDRLL